MNPLLQGHSGTTPEPSRNALSTSQGTNEDDSQNDPHPEAGLFHGQMTQNSGPEDDHDIYRAFTLGLFLWNWRYRLEISKNTLSSSPFFQNIRIYSVLDIVSFDLCPLYIFLNRFAFEHGKYSEASLSDHALEILSLGLVFSLLYEYDLHIFRPVCKKRTKREKQNGRKNIHSRKKCFPELCELRSKQLSEVFLRGICFSVEIWRIRTSLFLFQDNFLLFDPLQDFSKE